MQKVCKIEGLSYACRRTSFTKLNLDQRGDYNGALDYFGFKGQVDLEAPVDDNLNPYFSHWSKFNWNGICAWGCNLDLLLAKNYAKSL